MRVPEELFGTTKEVRSNSKKIITKLRKGHTIEEILERSSFVDINEYPESLIVMGVSGLNSEKHFRPAEFSHSLRLDRRLSQEQFSKIKEENVEFLSSTDWGTLILNWTEGDFWFMMTPAVKGLYRKGFISILEGTVEFWDHYMNIGKRFSIGASDLLYFNQTIPLSGRLLAFCGADPRTEGLEDVPHSPLTPCFGNIKRIIGEREILEKIKYDEIHWSELVLGKHKI